MSAPPLCRFHRVGQALRLTCACIRPGADGWDEDPDTAAEKLAVILRGRLLRPERIVLAAASIQSLDREDAQELADLVLVATCRGFPGIHPRSVAAEAAGWADTATRHERIAVAAAALHRLPQKDRLALTEALR